MIRIRKTEADKIQAKYKKHATRATVIQEEKKRQEEKKPKGSKKKVSDNVYNKEENHITEEAYCYCPIH